MAHRGKCGANPSLRGRLRPWVVHSAIMTRNAALAKRELGVEGLGLIQIERTGGTGARTVKDMEVDHGSFDGAVIRRQKKWVSAIFLSSVVGEGWHHGQHHYRSSLEPPIGLLKLSQGNVSWIHRLRSARLYSTSSSA